MSTDQETRRLKGKIKELFQVYPRMSPTMLQAGLGPSLSPSIWRPVMETMIEDGVLVMEAELPPGATGRSRPYTVLSLANPNHLESIATPPAPPKVNNVHTHIPLVAAE